MAGIVLLTAAFLATRAGTVRITTSSVGSRSYLAGWRGREYKSIDVGPRTRLIRCRHGRAAVWEGSGPRKQQQRANVTPAMDDWDNMQKAFLAAGVEFSDRLRIHQRHHPIASRLGTDQLELDRTYWVVDLVAGRSPLDRGLSHARHRGVRRLPIGGEVTAVEAEAQGPVSMTYRRSDLTPEQALARPADEMRWS